jgi:hypothetical protein
VTIDHSNGLTTSTRATTLHDRARAHGAEASAPPRILVYGAEGVGKTSLGVDAEEPLFVCAEHGLTAWPGQPKICPRTWTETLAELRQVAVEAKAAKARGEKIPFKTLVLDTLDFFQLQIIEYICKRDDNTSMGGKTLRTWVNDRPSVEGYNYGKWAEIAIEEWKKLLAVLEACHAAGYTILLLAHAAIQKEKNPEGNDFGTTMPAVQRNAVDLLVQWCDAVLFARYKMKVVEAEAGDPRAKRSKVVATDERELMTENGGAYRAKNRYSLPRALPMCWHDIAWYIEANDPYRARTLRAEIVASARRVRSGFDLVTIQRALTAAGVDVGVLETLKKQVAAEIEEAAKLREEAAALCAALPAEDAERAEKVRAWLGKVGDDLAGLRKGIEKLRPTA